MPSMNKKDELANDEVLSYAAVINSLGQETAKWMENA